MTALPSTSPTVSMTSAALGYASVGMRVFPVCPLRKRPLVADNLAVATTDKDQIKLWWSKWPAAMIGFPTGALDGATTAGVIIVDVDNGSGGFETLAVLEKELGPLPRSLVTHTPSGGLHIWLRWWPGVRIKSLVGKFGLGTGVDVRGCLADGTSKGYVIAAPSRRADGNAYRWAENVSYPLLCDEPGEIPAPWLFALAFSSRERAQLAKFEITGPQSLAGVSPSEWQRAAYEKLASAWRRTSDVSEGPLPLDASKRVQSYIEAGAEAELVSIRESPPGLQETTASNAALKLHGLIKGAAVCGLNTRALETAVAERFCAAVVAMLPGDITNPWTITHAREKWDRAAEAAEPRDLFRVARSEQPADDFEDVGAPQDGEAQEIKRLAALSPIGYDRERIASAEKLGIRVTVLDREVTTKRRELEPNNESVAFLTAPELWPDAVEAQDLMTDMVAIIRRHMVLPEFAAEVIALWIMHAHAHDAAAISPILAFESPEKRCGKTTAMSLVTELVPKPLSTSNITTAALFRAVDKFGPTLLIDEADTFLSDNDDLRGVLNSGHNRRSARVLRTVGDEHEPKIFSTWAPKVIAMIGELPDTLQDRAIAVRLRRKRTIETVERLRLDRIAPFAALQSQAARWAADHFDALKLHDPGIPQNLNDRASDNWRPLLAIADEIGGDWPGTARQAALGTSGADKEAERELSEGVQLLRDIRQIFDEARIADIEPGELLIALINLPEAPWADWRFGRSITSKTVAKMLASFSIKAQRDANRRYLPRAAFEDAWRRYVPS